MSSPDHENKEEVEENVRIALSKLPKEMLDEIRTVLLKESK